MIKKKQYISAFSALMLLQVFCSSCGVTFVGSPVQKPAETQDKPPDSRLTQDVEFDIGGDEAEQRAYVKIVLKKISTVQALAKNIPLYALLPNAEGPIVKEFSNTIGPLVVLKEIPIGEYKAEIFFEPEAATPASLRYLIVGATDSLPKVQSNAQSPQSELCAHLTNLSQQLVASDRVRLLDPEYVQSTLNQYLSSGAMHVVSVNQSALQNQRARCPNLTQGSSSTATGLSSLFPPVRVIVSSGDINLVLASQESVTWEIVMLPGANLRSLSVTGHFVSSVSGVPPSLSEVKASFRTIAQQNSPIPVPPTAALFAVPGFIENIGEPLAFGSPDGSGKPTCSLQPLEQPLRYSANLSWLSKFTGITEFASIQSVRAAVGFFVSESFREQVPVTRKSGLCYLNKDGIPEIQK